MPGFRRPESVLVLITDDQHQVLLLKRCDVPGFWQSVTGGLEAGETPRQAALRELREETGLDIRRVGRTLCDLDHQVRFEILPPWRHRYPPHVTHNLEHQFALQVPVGTTICLNPTEHSQYCWLPAEQAARRMSSWSNREALQQVARDWG